MYTCTVISPVNIAVVKYWGKRNVELNIPLNDSISATISTELLHTKTTIKASEEYSENRFWLNNVENDTFFESHRFKNCLRGIIDLAKRSGNFKEFNWKYHIRTINSFPTAAGLASSASGYCALVLALAKLHNVYNEKYFTELTEIARVGSGSACRSLFGGWVEWRTESLQKSYANQIHPATHWPNFKVIILVVNDQMKKIGSTDAMVNSAMNSEFLKYRISTILPKTLIDMKNAIATKSFEDFAKLVIQESNQLHAVCLDTHPPVMYLNDISFKIIDFVINFNKFIGSNKLAYTFDAGPNAFLFTEDANYLEVLSLILKTFPKQTNINWCDYIYGFDESGLEKLSKRRGNQFNVQRNEPGLLKMIYCTKIGNGPKFIVEE